MPETVNNPGYKTTEFWVTAITSAVVGLITLLNESGIMKGFQIPPEVVLTIIVPAVTYVLGRFGLKAVQVSATAKVEAAKAQAEGTPNTSVTVNNPPSA